MYKISFNSCLYRIPPLRGEVRWGLLLFVLAFLLGSCKQSNAVEAQTDVVSVGSIRMEDSLRADFRMQFDLLDCWEFDSVSFDSCSRPIAAKGAKHMMLHKGDVTETKTKTKTEQVADSTIIKAQEVIHPVRTPPKLGMWFVVVLTVFLLYIIIISRTHR